MTDYRRYFCTIRVDAAFNAGNLPMQNIQELNEKIKNVVKEYEIIWLKNCNVKFILNIWCRHE